MHYTRWVIGCLGFAMSAWLSACDGGGTGGGPSTVTAGSGSTTPSGTAGAGGRESGQRATAGTGTSRPSRCAERTQTVVAEGFNCSYACREGFADCDDSRDNGCETDLSAPDACDRCGLAYSCLMPELCGLADRTCAAVTTQVWTVSRPSGLAIGLGGFAADAGGEHIMTLGAAPFDNMTRTIDVSSGVAFRHQKGDIGTHLWTSQNVVSAGNPPKVERFGDQLLFFGSGEDDVVIASTDLDGNQRWSARLPASEYAEPEDVILDSEGNAYVWVSVTTGHLTIGDRKIEAGSIEATHVLVSYSPSGALRWVSSDDLPDEVYGNAVEGWKDLVIFGENIAVLRRGTFGLFSRADGTYKGKRDMDNHFASFADGDAFITRDGAGHHYVAAISNAAATANETPMADAVPMGMDELPDAFHAHVTKFDGTTGLVLWRRSLLWDEYRVEFNPSPTDAGMHIDSFAVGADGFSWVVISKEHDDDQRRQFLVGINSDGHIAAARPLHLEQNAHYVRVASDGTAFMSGKYEDWQVGDMLFEGPGVFVEQDTFERLAK